MQHADTDNLPEVLVAELRLTKSDLLWQLRRKQEATQELNAGATVEMSPAMRSRFLHLKALLLGEHSGPHALEHLLESYQQDRLRGDHAGVAISLLAIARIFQTTTRVSALANASEKRSP